MCSFNLQVESEEATNLAKLRALFPDYHSAFKDLVVDHEAEQNDDSNRDGTADAEEADVDARIKALGHMSDRQLSLVVARHCRIFLSLTDRRRRQIQRLLTSGATPLAGVEASGSRLRERNLIACCDAERVIAFGDSYRASVLLALPTSRLPSCMVLPLPFLREADVDAEPALRQASPVVHMEEAFAASHLLALANAARLCKCGKSLLEDSVGGVESASLAVPKKRAKQSKTGVGSGGVSGVGWLGDGAVCRNLSLVDPVVNFHLDANVAETRLADAPLAALLRRVADLLQEFPGHGVLIQVCHQCG